MPTQIITSRPGLRRTLRSPGIPCTMVALERFAVTRLIEGPPHNTTYPFHHLPFITALDATDLA